MVCFYLLNVMVSIMTAVSLRAAKNSMLSPLSLKSGRSQIFFKMGVPKNFAIFTVKHLCWSLFLIKLQKACNCINKTPTQLFFCEYCEIFKGSLLLLTQSYPFDAYDSASSRQQRRHQFDECKKQYVPLLFIILILWGIGMKKMKERTKISN